MRELERDEKMGPILSRLCELGGEQNRLESAIATLVDRLQPILSASPCEDENQGPEANRSSGTSAVATALADLALRTAVLVRRVESVAAKLEL